MNGIALEIHSRDYQREKFANQKKDLVLRTSMGTKNSLDILVSFYTWMNLDQFVKLE
jgi:hypothetical protein